MHRFKGIASTPFGYWLCLACEHETAYYDITERDYHSPLDAAAAALAWITQRRKHGEPPAAEIFLGVLPDRLRAAGERCIVGLCERQLLGGGDQ